MGLNPFHGWTLNVILTVGVSPSSRRWLTLNVPLRMDISVSGPISAAYLTPVGEADDFVVSPLRSFISYPSSQALAAMRFAGPYSVDLMTRVLQGLGPPATHHASQEDPAPSWDKKVRGKPLSLAESSSILSDVVNAYVHRPIPVTSCLC